MDKPIILTDKGRWAIFIHVPGRGGTERAGLLLAVGLKKIGCIVKVFFCTSAEGERLDWLIENDVPYILLPKTISEARKELISFCPTAISLQLNGEAPIVNSLLTEGIAPSYETNIFANKKTYSPFLTCTYVLSNWCLFQYRHRYSKTKPDALIIPNSFDLTMWAGVQDHQLKISRAKLSLPENSFVIGRVGQKFSGKWSVKYLTIAEKILEKNKNVYFLFCGIPEELQKKVEILNKRFNERIIFIDYIDDQENLKYLYAILDLFLHIAEQGESFGNVLIESLLVKTPVLTMATPQLDNTQVELIRHKETGLVGFGESGVLEGVLWAIENKSKLKKYTEKGHSTAVTRYNNRRIAQIWEDYTKPGYSRSVEINAMEIIWLSLNGFGSISRSDILFLTDKLNIVAWPFGFIALIFLSTKLIFWKILKVLKL